MQGISLLAEVCSTLRVLSLEGVSLLTDTG
jgi:hypothetical protein